jgi:Tol biopolymer transport system component
MPLSEGDRLGPYQIVGLLGSGGMGEVYRATDTRLNRSVAIKVLPPDLALDVERRQRFEREARLVASLNHPDICAVHDVGSQLMAGGTAVSYLVMEYLEGETLAERLARGPLSLDDTIQTAAGIANALAAAHRKQIVHRDLKPANVMLTKSGLKLLDFGIAKTVPGVSQPGEPILSTKAMTVATVPGTMPGTVPYMSPEQLNGRAVDARSDIFALGAVVFEMATGTRAFPGDSFAAIASSILTSTPPPIAVSPALDRIVRNCLERDSDRRWQSAHDVALQLAAIGERNAAAEAERPRRARQWLPWAVALVAVALAASALVSGRRARLVTTGTPAPGRAVTFQTAPPEPGEFRYHVEYPGIAVSPDGSHVAFSAVSRTGDTGLWVRPLDSLQARLLEGTEDAASMFWSPDSRSIAFFAEGKLKRIALAGGKPVTICETRRAIGQAGTWGADGTILIGSVQGEQISKVAASGGTLVEVMKPDRKRNETRVLWPSFLPDGRSFVFTVTFSDDSGALMFKQPDTAPRELSRAKSNAQYVDPGYLLFVQDSSLIARRFDAATGALSGDPIAVASPIVYFFSTALAQFSASRTGMIAFHSHTDLTRVAMVDRSGKELETVRQPAGYQSLRLSRDGRQLLFDRTDPRTTAFDVFLFETDRGAETQLTSNVGTEAYPVWGPRDTIIYMSVSGGAPRLTRRALHSGAEEPIGPDGLGLQQPSDVSPDGQWLVYSQRTTRGDFDLHGLHLQTEGGSLRRRRSTNRRTVFA